MATEISTTSILITVSIYLVLNLTVFIILGYLQLCFENDYIPKPRFQIVNIINIKYYKFSNIINKDLIFYVNVKCKALFFAKALFYLGH